MEVLAHTMPRLVWKSNGRFEQISTIQDLKQRYRITRKFFGGFAQDQKKKDKNRKLMVFSFAISKIKNEKRKIIFVKIFRIMVGHCLFWVKKENTILKRRQWILETWGLVLKRNRTWRILFWDCKEVFLMLYILLQIFSLKSIWDCFATFCRKKAHI